VYCITEIPSRCMISKWQIAMLSISDIHTKLSQIFRIAHSEIRNVDNSLNRISLSVVMQLLQSRAE